MKTPFIYLFLFFASAGFSQNLVPNPSFEDMVMCPYSSNQVGNCEYWMSFRDSPDYFNACSSSSFCNVPKNYFGFQEAKGKEAYCGLFTYELDEYREIIGVRLNQKLSIGTRYFCSFYAARAQNLPGDGAYASNNLGVLFTNHQYSQFNRIPITNQAHVNYDQILIDTLNWTLISGSFIADSEYQYLSIGNFFDYSNTDTFRINPNPAGYSAYYYIDDVYVGIDSVNSIVMPFLDSKKKVYPNPAIDYLSIPEDVNVDVVILQSYIGQQFKFEFIDNEKIDVSEIPRGLYLCTMKYKNKIINSSILILINP
jgi:hypothetical protein